MGNIAHASKDERNQYKNGVAGDQTGKEVCIRSWYNRPWNVVLRADEPAMRESIARFMEKVCSNNRIGYDQNQRTSLHRELRRVNFNPDKIMGNCETDCSALVSDACIAAGIEESYLFLGGNLATTANLRAKLKATKHFEVFTASKYTASEQKLCRGDILLYEGHHVAVYVSGSTRPMLHLGDECNDVRALQKLLNKQGISIPVTGKFDIVTTNAVIEAQGYHELEKDGICGPLTWGALER